MQATEDNSLLRQYAETGSEDAFSRLVAQNVDLVYSTAVRQVGNPSQAEEITQAVFTILARKASSLGTNVIVAGWLYQATRLTAANLVRSEMRRVRREQEAYMQSLTHDLEAEVWTQIAPLLESAMGSLNHKERDAIVLRFFQGKSMVEVGNAFGSSENAAKKRIQRALEKMRTFFAKRNVVLTTAIIAGSVSAHSVQAASPGLASVVTAAAVKGAAGSSSTLTIIKGALKIMAWTKVKSAAVVAAVVLCAAGTATVTVHEVARHHDDSVWGSLTRIDSRLMDKLPPMVALRQSPAKNRLNGMVSNGKRKMAFGLSVPSLLSYAYDISSTRVLDGNTLPAGKYDFFVTVKDPGDKKFRAAISQKLGLTAEKVMRDTDVLLLKVARPNSPNLKTPVEINGSSSTDGNSEYHCKNSGIDNVAGFLESSFKEPVIDQTGLTARYDIDLTWKGSFVSQGPDVESLRQALLDQLGLELVPSRQPVQMLLVKNSK